MNSKLSSFQKKFFFVFHIILITTFFYILSITKYSLLLNYIKKISIIEWFIIFGLFLILSLLRGIRFHFLSGIRFSWIYIIIVFHNFFRDILPLKERELAYVKKLYDLGYSYDTPVFHIVTIRLYDIFLSSFFLLMLLILGFIQSRYQIVLIVIIAGSFLLLTFYSSKLINILGFFISPYIRHTSRKVSTGISLIQKEYQNIKIKDKIFLSLFSTVNALLSLFIWTFILHLIFPNLGMIPSVVASFFFKFLRIVPVYPFAGLGIFELLWFIALYSTELSFDEISAFSLLAHGIFLVQTSILYFFANLIEFRKKLKIFSHPVK